MTPNDKQRHVKARARSGQDFEEQHNRERTHPNPGVDQAFKRRLPVYMVDALGDGRIVRSRTEYDAINEEKARRR